MAGNVSDWIRAGVCAAAVLALTACGAEEPASPKAAAKTVAPKPSAVAVPASASGVFQVGFVSSSDGPTGPARADVRVHAAQTKGKLTALRFTTRLEGAVVEERFWEAAKPTVIHVRTWEDCKQITEPMPAPRPTSLQSVLEEYFGPRPVPKGHRTAGGKATWETKVDEDLVKRFADDGSPYPTGRTAEIISEGQVGNTVSNGSLTNAQSMPSWTPAWSTCKPAPQA
ncbi:hypothetical protein ACFVH6_41760 [Spirillospora sp. NPDC127200]